ncbi:MAG: diguanylate cyclase response regulator [Rhodospirillaceae bacterium]|jgi:diguanylate cyclase (GGDEF)-like protein|nr:diguanylate cyclase response regulator [Rhodospirillaceae bacterium]MBT5241704.1 diguanylate cyclase response regulator [Rhodospirillaceae bacterium]MBT5564828.1 diguanylate cyclase response regulator [Rhodospirillaceae bacterium]MBT6089208.1 diguanylate cyclase response regulator [Rhodospirillaceae bacterium]MBT7451016.1 diguanylate cyclase response regulator [Rhodospirillaceae bacterium]
MPRDTDFKHNTIRILVVDGDDAEADSLVKSLCEAGFRKANIVVARSFDDAVNAVEKETLQVALINYNLPSHTGFELMEELMRMGNPVPVIMTAEAKDSKIDSGAMERGAYDYLIHSEIDPELLERTIRYTIIRRKLEDRLVHAALYDELSSLPNRRAFFDRLKQGLFRADRHKQELSIVYIDLNGFKAVNDTHGHQAGDEVIREIGKRLEICLRRTDTPARLGGDEFACILEDFRDRKAALAVIDKIINIFADPIPYDGVDHQIGGSLGVSFYPENATDADLLIQLADESMYQAKVKSRRTGKPEMIIATPEEKTA